MDCYEYIGGEYTTYIVDECGTPMYKCSELYQAEIDEILDKHPEWYIRTMQ